MINNFYERQIIIITVLYKNDIAVYTCDHSLLNILRCISQSRRIKQICFLSFSEKPLSFYHYIALKCLSLLFHHNSRSLKSLVVIAFVSQRIVL